MPSTTSSLSLPEKFAALNAELNTELIQRRAEIDGALLALIARRHMLLLGEPGAGKTLLVDRLVVRLAGATFFSTLLRKTSPPEDVFGPLSIPALKEGRYEFLTRGYLPEAHLALLDEAFKANSSVLNGMLGVLNERRFRNDGEMRAVPLTTAYLASNEMPQEEDLAAMYDRIHLRFEVHHLVDPADRKRMLLLEHDPTPPPMLTWAEVTAAQMEAAAIPVTDEAVDAIIDIREKLAEIGVEPSDRRLRESLAITRAQAWLAGDDKVQPIHCEPLVHMFWEQPDQAREVERSLLSVVSPGHKAVLDLSDGIAALAEAVASTITEPEGDTRIRQGNELIDKMKKARQEVDAMLPSTDGRSRKTLGDASTALDAANARLLIEVYSVKPDSIAGLRS